MTNKKKVYGIAFALLLVAMFAWIFVAVGLTGGRDVAEFTPQDEKIMTVFIVVELLTAAALAVVAVLLGRQVGMSRRQQQQMIEQLQEQKKSKRGLWLLILACLISFGCLLGGIYLKTRLSAPLQEMSIGVLVGCIGLALLLALLNWLLSKRYLDRLQQKNVAQMQAFFYSHRENAQATAKEKYPVLVRSRRWTAVYAVFLGLLGCVTITCAGIGLETGTAGGLTLAAVALILCPLSRIRFSVAKEVFEESHVYVKKEDYPQLYALAEEARQKMDCNGQIRIALIPGCGAGIACLDGIYSIHLGVLLLSILRREELQSILLHEFSHMTQQHRGALRERRYNDWLHYQQTPHFLSGITDLMFRYANMYYIWQYILFSYATSVLEEVSADRAMLLSETPAAAASSLVKLQYYELFTWQKESMEEPCVYEPEEPDPQIMATELAQFRAAAGQYAALWDELIAKELESRSASHPIVVDRIKALGLEQPRLQQLDTDPAMADTVAKAVAFVDQLLLEDVKKNYEQCRQDYYLEPKQTVADWESKGEPLVMEEYADLMWALRQLGDNRRTLALCERAIRELSPIAACHAYFIRGCIRLHSFDPAGIEDMYMAMENNSNYVDEGLMTLGQFCCLTGNREELERYRKRGVELQQKFLDEGQQANTLTRNDRLSTEQLPEGMLEQILAYIASVDQEQIRRIYLVRKTVSDSFFTSVFVVEFLPDGDEKLQSEILHKIFRYLDTCSDWQFSLFDYRDVAHVPLQQIENSCVYQK